MMKKIVVVLMVLAIAGLNSYSLNTEVADHITRDFQIKGHTIEKIIFDTLKLLLETYAPRLSNECYAELMKIVSNETNVFWKC